MGIWCIQTTGKSAGISGEKQNPKSEAEANPFHYSTVHSNYERIYEGGWGPFQTYNKAPNSTQNINVGL